MPDMYDKLGEMLNEALESGRIPKNEKNDQVTSDEKKEESGHFSFNNSKKSTVNNNKSTENTNNHHCEAESRSNPTGEVIKLHKYTYNMQFPPHIHKAFNTLDIAYPFSVKDVKKQYRKLLKENHPDIQNTIQTSQHVEKCRQKSIDDITRAYKILCQFFGIK